MKLRFESLEDRRMMSATDPVIDRIAEIRDNFGQQVDVGTRGDFDNSGVVDFKDFLLVAGDLKTLHLPVKWTIPDQQSREINKILENGIVKMSIFVANKNGKFESTCDVLLGDLKTTNTQCKIIVDATNLLITDNPWVVTVVFKRQQISLKPSVSIATVNVERLIDPALLLQVKSTQVQFGATDFRAISVRRPYVFVSP